MFLARRRAFARHPLCRVLEKKKGREERNGREVAEKREGEREGEMGEGRQSRPDQGLSHSFAWFSVFNKARTTVFSYPTDWKLDLNIQMKVTFNL